MTRVDRSKLFLGAVLLVACTTKESKPGGAVVGVPSAEPPREEPVVEANGDRQPGDAVLLGVIRRFGTEVCKGRGSDETTWKDVHLRAGLVRIEGEAGGLAALRGEPAILFGKVTGEGKPKLAREEGDCMPMQRRSDWVTTPDGTVLQRDPTPDIATFRVRSAKRFEGLRAKEDGSELAIELENPLDVSLLEATLVVHYEGCYGKPMTHEEKRELGTLAKGGRGAAKVPLVHAEKRGDRDLTHRPHSIQVSGKADGVYFDLDIRLDKLGAEQTCPKR
jgi:hypothetical protein